jgi:predicted TIM-barrel fold metal-dependent hydrolase
MKTNGHHRRTILKMMAGGAALTVSRTAVLGQQVPWSSGTEKPKTRAPANTTDCHHHIYDARFPAAPEATLRPPDASIADYRLLQQRLGTARNVVVQPSTYGIDNRLLLEALQTFGSTARGIVMLDTSVSDEELKRMQNNGVRGVRFGTRLPGGAPIEMMEPVAKRVADLGWHIQLVSEGERIVELKETLSRLPCPVVFDHMGHVPEPEPTSHPAFRVIGELIDKNKAWVKLSGVYILSKVGPPIYADRSLLAKALVKLAPERMVWGSDWPHPTSQPDAKPDDAVLFDLIAEWAPDETTRKRILVDNPAQLYGFA